MVIVTRSARRLDAVWSPHHDVVRVEAVGGGGELAGDKQRIECALAQFGLAVLAGRREVAPPTVRTSSGCVAPAVVGRPT